MEKWSINNFSSAEEKARQEALKKKIEADRNEFASCYLKVDNKLQIHIYDKIYERRYVFTTDLKLEPYINILKSKGYYEFVKQSKEQSKANEDKVDYYLEYKSPIELSKRGFTGQVIQLHSLESIVNDFEAEANYESIIKANDKRAVLTKLKKDGGKYVLKLDHISNRKITLPHKQEIVLDNKYEPLVANGEYTPQLTPEEAEQYQKFCDILPKLDEDFLFDKEVCITPINLNHAQSCNEYDNLVYIDSPTNKLKSYIIDKHLGLYAGIKHKENIFVITFYSQSSFVINNDKCHRFSVIYNLPTHQDKIQQILLQAEALKDIYNKYDIAREEAQEIYQNYGEQDTTECWNKIKQVYARLIRGKEVHYISTEEMKQDFTTLWLNKEVFFAPGDKRVKIVKSYAPTI